MDRCAEEMTDELTAFESEVRGFFDSSAVPRRDGRPRPRAASQDISLWEEPDPGAEASLAVAADNIQVHGGIGFTWEHPAHLYFRRALADSTYLGDARLHRELLVRRLGLDGMERTWS